MISPNKTVDMETSYDELPLFKDTCVQYSLSENEEPEEKLEDQAEETKNEEQENDPVTEEVPDTLESPTNISGIHDTKVEEVEEEK